MKKIIALTLVIFFIAAIPGELGARGRLGVELSVIFHTLSHKI